MRKKKEINLIKCLCLVLILAVLALSFVPCNKIVKYSSAMNPDSLKPAQVSYEGLEPDLCAKITMIELLLLLLSKRTWSTVVCFILNLIKISIPMLYFLVRDIFGELLNDIGVTEVIIGWSAYVIIGLGIVIGAAEIIEIVSSAKEKRLKSQGKRSMPLVERFENGLQKDQKNNAAEDAQVTRHQRDKKPSVNRIESPVEFNSATFDIFFHDLKNDKLPYIPTPTEEEVREYTKKHPSAFGNKNPMMANNDAIPVEIQIWVDKVYDFYFDDLVPMLGLVHRCDGARKALYDYKGYKWFTASECHPGWIID